MPTAAQVAERFSHAVGGPVQAMLEISDRCNEVCVHCYQEQGQKGEMDTGEVLALLDQLAAQGILFLTISGGEPTLRKDFLEIVAHAHRLGFVQRIFTNGLSMSRELAKALYDHAVQALEISVYSHRPDVHDFVTGVQGSFERTVQGIRYLVEAGVMVIIKTPVMSLNEDDLEEYVALAESLGVHYALSPGGLHPREGGERHHQAFSLSDAGYRKVIADSIDAGVIPQVTGPARKREGQRPCGAGRSVHIEPNGEMRPCTLLEVDLGNVRGRGVEAARRDSEALAALQDLTWEHLHGCRDCDLSGYCGHCYAHALSETGDALGPYPSACRDAMSNYEVSNSRQSPAGVAAAQREPAHAPVCGPFRVQPDGSCVVIEDVVTDADRQLAARLGWTRRREGGTEATSVLARPGKLIQLRRPGAKRTLEVRVPGPVDAEGRRRAK